jgi:hypothetical protein
MVYNTDKEDKMIKRIEKYITIDRQEFPNQTEAEKHDEVIKSNDPIYKLITNDIDRWYDGDSNAQWQDEVYDFIIEFRESLKSLL